MRLIDEDNIRGCAKYIKINEYFEPYIMGDDLVKLLDAQPTAYDVDKVVAELEKESYTIMLDGALVASKEVVIDAKRATEIVKQGGKEILQ